MGRVLGCALGLIMIGLFVRILVLIVAQSSYSFPFKLLAIVAIVLPVIGFVVSVAHRERDGR
jgi:uncharacterized protein YacL